MKTAEMEIAIMNYLNIRVNIVVPNVSWALLDYEADIVSLTKAGYATEIEIKVSKSDLLADLKKKHQHNSDLFKYLYYAVPQDLADCALEVIPKRAGLLTVKRNEKRWYGQFYDGREFIVDMKRQPKVNACCKKWDERKMFELTRLGCMRIYALKKKLVMANQKEDV